MFTKACKSLRNSGIDFTDAAILSKIKDGTTALRDIGEAIGIGRNNIQFVHTRIVRLANKGMVTKSKPVSNSGRNRARKLTVKGGKALAGFVDAISSLPITGSAPS